MTRTEYENDDAAGESAMNAVHNSAHQDRVRTGKARLPLYLIDRGPARVDADGPSLVVRSPQRADARYPLCRLSRIITGSHVEWSARALDACRRERLIIVFLDGHGQTTGYLYPAHAHPAALGDLIEEILDRPDWTEIYADWLRAQRMSLVERHRRTCSAAGRMLDEDDYRDLVRLYVYRADDTGPLLPPESIAAAALTARVHQTLREQGLRPRYFGTPLSRVAGRGLTAAVPDRWRPHAQIPERFHWSAGIATLELADDLTSLLELSYHLDNHGLGVLARSDDLTRLRLLHRNEGRMDGYLKQVLGSLHRDLASRLDTWL